MPQTKVKPSKNGAPKKTAQQRKAKTEGSWKPGQSGNPNGSPKKSESLANQVRAILHEPISKADKRSHMQVILTKAVEQAEKGDYKAREFLANRGFGMAEQRIKQEITKEEIIVIE